MAESHNPVIGSDEARITRARACAVAILGDTFTFSGPVARITEPASLRFPAAADAMLPGYQSAPSNVNPDKLLAAARAWISGEAGAADPTALHLRAGTPVAPAHSPAAPVTTITQIC